MERNTIIVGLLMLVVGLGVGYTMSNVGAPVGGNHVMSDGVAMRDTSMDMTASMQGMMNKFEGKSGDEFDRVFLEEMIVHHEGAVEMAQALLRNTTRSELQKLGNDIISAQTGEIQMMRGWLTLWYGQ